MRSNVLISTLFIGLVASAPIEPPPSLGNQPWALSIPRPARFTADPARAKRLGNDTASTANTTSLSDWASTEIVDTETSLWQTAASAIDRLLSYADAETHEFPGIGWWQTGNAYTAALQLDVVQNAVSAMPSIAGEISPHIKALIRARPHGLANEFNDDTLWWANACLDAHVITDDGEFLDEARRLWEHVRATSLITETGVAPDMGGVRREHVLSRDCALEGGVYWTTKPDERYVNSITTGLMMQVSSRLAEHGKYSPPHYLETALRNLEWLRDHTVDDSVQLVDEDGVNGTSCKLNAGAYTYNTGVYIGGLVSLYKNTHDRSYLEEAEEAAFAAMETDLWTDGNGFITENRHATENSDGASFRSILIRNLLHLFSITKNEELQQEIRGFLNVNYNTLYTRARNGDNYDGDWEGPFKGETAWGQMSAIDLLVAGWAVNDNIVGGS